MEKEMHISNVSSNEKDSEQDRDNMKSRLKKQIKDLKSLILEMEWSSDIVKFGKTKPAYDLNIPDAPIDKDIYHIPNVNIKLQSELYRYSGLYCVEFSHGEHIFNFSPLNRYDKGNTFVVQILNKQNVGTLGKWIMPMSIDLDDLVSEFSISNLKNVPRFVRTCKHYIDCYVMRCQQFNALKDSICRKRNCTLQTNLGYTCITLELTGVYDANNDLYINIILYLMYGIDETRPWKIQVDSKTEQELNLSTEQQLRTSLKCFKKFDLETAFDKMLNEKPFTWAREDEEDSPVETNYLSSSDEEGYLQNFSFVRKKRFKLHKSRKKSKRKHNETEQRNVSGLSENFESNDKSVSQENEEPAKNLNRRSMRRRDTDATKSAPKIRQIKLWNLKQTKLKFQVDNNSELRTENNSTTSREPATEKKTRIAKLCKPFTSTPIHKNHPSTSHLVAAISMDNISDIPVNEDNSQNTKAKTDTDAPKQTESFSKDQSGNNVPAKMLKSRMKKNAESSIRSKPTTKKKNVSRKKVKKP
ncbi:uncharacterized protein LOC143371128 [Andrena cerasifolii]|uniref:uncharacterized protein LOC143371128 n=1 Tax=Andrena cerasifolii TaxID=2819439 RepID=UPI00403821F9